MTALRYLPGQVVAFGSESLLESFDDSYLSVFGEAVSGRGYQFRSGPHWLELFAVNEGEELRFLELVRSQPGVLAASLNYIGLGLGETYIDEEPPERLNTPGKAAGRDTQFFFQLIKDRRLNESLQDEQDLISRLRSARPSTLIAAVDVKPGHCASVLSLMSEGFKYNRSDRDPLQEAINANTAVIGLTASLDRSEITDLHGIAGRLAFLAELMGPKYDLSCELQAINLSVDFSQVIRGYNALDPASAESPDMLYSLPYFEAVLARVVADISHGHSNRPAIFAAAGNRRQRGDAPRVRLGYPAARPETMAATFVTSTAEDDGAASPVDWVDVPATTGLKPCFAIDVNAMPVSDQSGSSFASAWLAGYYTSLVRNNRERPDRLGLLSKVAWLMGRTERRRLPGGRQRLPCFTAVVQTDRMIEREDWDLDELVALLNKEFAADFCIHGSMAATGEWLRLNERHFSEISPVARKDLGDLDLLYWGSLDAEQADEAKKLAQAWLKQQLGRSWVAGQKRPVELHSYEGLVTKGERLRSITPATKLYVTAGGVIDTWGGLDDLEQKSIRFLPMTHPDFWERNSHFSSGADCLAYNILQWIGMILLLQLVSRSVQVAGPVADPKSLAKVNEILAAAGDDNNQQIPLFSRRLNDVRERLDRRFDRVETLLGSCARQKIASKDFDRIVKDLHTLRNKIDGTA